MLPQDFTQSLDETARTASAYPQIMPAYVSQGIIRPQLGHTAFVQSQGQQQFLVPVVAPSQHVVQQPLQVVPQMNMAMVCAPMRSDTPVHTLQSPGIALAPAVYRPAVYSVVAPTRAPRQAYGNMWAPLPGVGRLEHMPGAVLGQATSVEELLQMLRSFPRGASSVPIIAESLRFLDSR